MKKVSTIIMALAVVFGMTQCTKPAMQLYDGSYTGVTKEITFSTGGSSKVTVDNSVLNELKFKWEDGDHLYVYGSANNPFSGGAYCGSLALVKGEGTENGFFSGTLDNVPTSGTLRFYYCPNVLFDKEQETITVDLSSQDGSLEDVASHLVACADVAVKPDGGDYSATLAVPYAVVKFDLSAFGTTDITMTGTTNKGLTVTANGVKDVMTGGSTTLSGVTSESNAYYVAVMPESVTTLNFSGNGLVGSKSVTLSENRFETLNGGGGSVPVPALIPGELPGVFTVSAGPNGIAGDEDDMKVHFSKGNLYWDGSAFKMETNQWGTNPTAVGVEHHYGYYDWDPSHISHFLWSNTTDWQTPGMEPYAENYSYSTQTVSDVFFTEASGFEVEGQTGWRTLSYAEWNYLLGYDPDEMELTEGYGRANAMKLTKWVKLYVSESGAETVNGRVILPDGGSESLLDSYNDSDSPMRPSVLSSNGAVFLPAAGRRDGTRVDFIGSVGNFGNYWSSTLDENYESFAQDLYFDRGYVFHFSANRCYGFCVRLVR